MTLEVEYDHADRSPIHDQESGVRCTRLACREAYVMGEAEFEFKGKGFNTFEYYLYCPACGHRRVDVSRLSSLAIRFRITK